MSTGTIERPELPAARTNGEQHEALIAVASQREVAEVQGAMTIAKKFPRDQQASLDRIMTACQRKTLAETAVYQYAKGGTDISGPSIRLAETLAREWGNLQFGIRELEQRQGESTVEAFAIDLETNVRCVKVFQCRHVRHARNGDYKLNDPREIYELVANQGARRVRNCILGIIPGDVVEAALEQCESTLKTSCEVTPERVKAMLEKFGTYKVTKEMIEARIQRRLDAMTPAQLLSLGKIYNSLKDGMSTAKDWFLEQAAEGDESTKGTAGLEKKLGKKAAAHETAQQEAARQRTERLAAESDELQAASAGDQ